MSTIRRIGIATLAIAAVLVCVLLAPTPVETPERASTHTATLQQIDSSHQSNNSSAQGAPQQAVVNGWTTNELLIHIPNQLEEQLQTPQAEPAQDERPAALLLVLVLAACLHWGTQGTAGTKISNSIEDPSLTEDTTSRRPGPSAPAYNNSEDSSAR